MIAQEILEKILDFRRQRDWEQFHTPKNLAGSVVIESAELMEVFQWIDNVESKEFANKNIKKVRNEIADILIYLAYLCHDLGIDMDEAIKEKIDENGKKYPEAKSKGNSKKYTEL